MPFGELGGGVHLAAPQPPCPHRAPRGSAGPWSCRGAGCTRGLLHTLCLDSQERRASAWQPELISLRAPQSIPGGVRAALRGLRAPCFAMGPHWVSPRWAMAAIKPEQMEQRRLGLLGGGPGLFPYMRNILRSGVPCWDLLGLGGSCTWGLPLPELPAASHTWGCVGAASCSEWLPGSPSPLTPGARGVKGLASRARWHHQARQPGCGLTLHRVRRASVSPSPEVILCL